MTHSKKKFFVLDTNVILHDSACIYQFHEHNVVLPITVLEELDHFKKGNESVNFHAREFLRSLDNLSGDKLFASGVKIGENLGHVIVKLEPKFHQDLEFNFTTKNPDHHILNTAYHLAKDHPLTPVILVSKDVNLRLKAKAIGLMSQDYRTDHVEDISTINKADNKKENIPSEMIEKFYAEKELDPAEIGIPLSDLKHNQYFVMRNGNKSILAIYDERVKTFRKVEKRTAYGISPRNAGQIFAMDALMNPKVKLVTLSGKAGTGKTLLALACALESMSEYTQICMARPIVPLSNKDIGFLPGDVHSKMAPYIQPLYDNLGVIKSQSAEGSARNKKIKSLQDEEKLVIAPLSYIRGRSLVNSFFIVDEAQNLTPHEVKTVLTRAGDGTKIVLTGDIFQIDHPYLNAHSNGLSGMIHKMQGQHIYAHVNLEKGERSELAELASNLL